MPKHVVIIPGDDAAPEAMAPAVEILKSLLLDLTFTEFPPGEEGVKQYGSRGAFDAALREAIDRSDSTLFGSTNGTTGGLNHLRWGKKTFANVRPVRWHPGFRSPLKNPEGIDFVIVRENLEDLYMGLEGDLSLLSSLPVTSWLTRKPLDTSPIGKFAIKVITEEGSRRIARFACELTRKRKAKGGKGKITCTSKYNMLRESDGLFRRVVEETAKGYPDLQYEQYIVDDFARRIVATPGDFDVVVMPNLYGDILSDAAAGTIGGLGLAPSGCYGETYAYFESIHGSAPDIAGRHIINPTATLSSAIMMLEYLGFEAAASRLDQAIVRVYADGQPLTPDQGGSASTTDFCTAVRHYL
ncbi:MAG: isocitrate/isopropylmalate dehydrogenase family protein [Deltaproteobacteria bacterium]|nr:isocitrate/isopropylmalate dehydrogenase family protein [Deltaproteobacteria bacterium]